MEEAPAQSEQIQQQQQSIIQQLRSVDKHATWHLGLRTTIIVLDLLGIGLAAWLTSNYVNQDVGDEGFGYYSSTYLAPYLLIAVAASLIYCVICILVPVLRKTSHRPVHPGAQVAIDLIAWLAFIITGSIALGMVIILASFGSNPGYLSAPVGGYGYGYSYGSYHLAANGTWVWHTTYGGYGGSSSNVTRTCTPYFSSCAAEDAYVNKLWKEKPRDMGIDVTFAAVQWINCILHFILFVWACVNTHRLNRSKRAKAYQQGVANRIIEDLQARGLIIVNPGGQAPRTEEENPILMSEIQQAPPR